MTIAESASTPDLSSERRLSGGLLALLAGLAAIGALATNIILPAFPAMAGAFGVAPRALGVTLWSFFIAFALGQLVVGPLSDRMGRKPLVLGGLFVFIAGSLLAAGAESLSVLVAGRVIQALGVCAATVLARAIARDLFDGDVLARALALTMVAMAAAPGFSPLLGGALVAGFGWQAPFCVVAAAALVLAGLYAVALGETHPADRRSAASAGAILRAYGSLAADLRFLAPALAVSLVLGGLYALFGAAPAILMAELGLDTLQLGLFFAATVFVVFGAGLLAPRLAHRFGAGRMVAWGILLALLGGAWMGMMPHAALGPFAAAVSLFLLGMGLVNPLGTAIALHPFGRQAGLASALLGFLQMAFAALGTALAAALPLAPVPALGCVMTGGACLAALAWRLPRTS